MNPGLTWRRSRAHAGILVAFAVTSAVFAALVAGLATSTADQLDHDVARALADLPPRSAALRVTATTRMDEEVRAAERLARRAEASGLVVTASTRADDIVVGPRSFLVEERRELAGLASLTSGRWAVSDSEATLTAAAAERLRVSPGDTLDLGPVSVLVVGTWAADDPTDPRWFGDPGVASGSDAGAVGPVVLSAATLVRLPDYRTSTWTLTVPSSVGGSDLDRLTSALRAFVEEADDAGAALDGSLADRVREIARAESSVNAVRRVALVLVGVVGTLVMWHVAGAVRAARSTEAMLVVARGASPGQVIAWHGGDVAIIGALGSALGLVACSAALGPPSPYVLAVAVVVPPALAIARAWPPAVVGRSGTAPVALVVAILLAGAGILLTARAAWLGDVVLESSSGAVRVDGLTVLAPALVLVAAAVVAVLLTRPLLGAAARVAARASNGLALVLALRRAGGRSRATAATLTLVALVVGTAAASAVASASAGAVVDRTREMQTGDDVRVSVGAERVVDGRQSPQVDLGPYAGLPAVDRVRGAVETPVGVADLKTTLLAVDGGEDGDGVVAGAVPIAITGGLASDLDVVVGDRLEVLVPDVAATFPAVVRRIARSLSGLPTGEGMVASRTAVQTSLSKPEALLTVNTLLLSSGDPLATARAVPSVADRPVTVVRARSGQGELSPGAAQTAWRWAAVGVALLGAIGLAAVVLGSVRGSRAESAVLGALGATRAVRGRARLGESAVAMAAGLVAGVAGAVLLVAVLVPVLSRALVPETAPDLGRVVALDGPVLAASLVLLASAAIVITLAGVVVARGDADDLLRKEDV